MLHTLDTSGTVRDARGFASKYVDYAVLDGILHVHQSLNMHLLCDLSCILLDGAPDASAEI